VKMLSKHRIAHILGQPLMQLVRAMPIFLPRRLSRKAVVDNESTASSGLSDGVPIPTMVAPDSRRNNSSSPHEWFGSGIAGITRTAPKWSLSLITSGPF
jgi:hypothetical protein